MAGPVEVVEFDPDEPEAALDLMRRVLADGEGWLNLQPALAVEEIPPQPGVFGRLFGFGGPVIPLASWVPEPGVGSDAQAFRAISLGVQHGFGKPGLPRLRELGLWPVPGWLQLTDNARRGLVVQAPVDGELGAQLEWLVTASIALTRVQIPDDWRATRFA